MMLPVSPWFADATVGGMVAANDFGPERLTGGGWRDAVIGLELIDHAGNIVRSGGKVVKNVTGYDISRLMIGSLGGLGVITAVNVKMMPALHEPWTLAISTPDGSWLKRVRALHLTKSPIDWLQAVYHEGEWRVGVGVSGNDERRARLIGDVKACLGDQCSAFPENEAPPEFAFFRPDIRQGGFLSPHISQYKDRFFHLHGIFPSDDWLDDDWWLPASGDAITMIAHPVGGDVHWIMPSGNEADLFAGLRRAASGRKGYLVIERAGEMAVSPPVTLPAPNGYPLMRRLKDGLDPNGIFISPFFDAANTESP
jgi:FAD/FMN-containing dehydrogenase